MPPRRPTPGSEPAPATYDSLDGQVALVTGANRGIGAEIARRLAELGARVYAGTRSVRNEVPENCEAVPLDVTQEGDVEAAITQIGETAGRLDVLVNNAGVGKFDDPLHEEQTPTIDRTFSVNLRGPTLLSKYALPPLLERPGGRIVNVSSGMGAISEDQSGGAPAYRVSKAGLNGLTTYLHGEYNEQGLMANAVCPGWVRTDLGGEEAERSVEKRAETPTWLCRFTPDSPSGAFWRDKERIDW